MKKVRFIPSLLILSFILSIIMPSMAMASETASADGNYETFNYNSEQSGIDSKVFLPNGWQPNTPDKFMVRTPDAREKGEKSIVGATPEVPTGLVVTKTANNSITVKWNKAANAKKYTVYLSTNQDSGYKSKGSTKSTTFTVKGLKKNKTYFMKVCAENGKNKSAKSNYTKGTATTKPGITTGITATPIDANTIQLQWLKAANASYYEVYASADESDFDFAGKTTNLGMNIGSLDYDSEYCFGIVAYNKFGYTVGECVYASTLRYPAPTGLTAQVVENTKAQLSWTGVSGAQEYDIYYAYDGDTAYTYYGSTPSTSYTTNGLRENSNCYFTVCSSFNDDQSDLSNEAKITTGYEVPVTPTLNLPTVSGTASISLSWSAVSKATDYHIYVSSVADGPYTLITRAESISTSYDYTAIMPNTDYYFKVSAVNHGVEGAQSASQLAHVSGSTP